MKKRGSILQFYTGVGIFLFALLAGLSFYVFFLSDSDFTLVYAPENQQPLAVSSNALENYNKEGFPIAGIQSGWVEIESNHEKELVPVSYTTKEYFQVFPQAFITGGPFVNEKDPVVVLNQAAAFQLFGTMDISLDVVTTNQQLTRIGGVFQDGKEKPHLYLPLASDKSSEFLVFTNTGDLSQSQILSSLGQLGLQPANYSLFQSRDSQRWAKESMVILSLLLLFCFLLAKREKTHTLFLKEKRLYEKYREDYSWGWAVQNKPLSLLQFFLLSLYHWLLPFLTTGFLLYALGKLYFYRHFFKSLTKDVLWSFHASLSTARNPLSLQILLFFFLFLTLALGCLSILFVSTKAESLGENSSHE